MALLVARRQVGVRPEVHRAAGDEALAHRLVQHPHVDGLDDGDLVVVGVDQIGQPVQQLGPALRSERRPLLERVHGGRHGGVGCRCVAAGDVGQLPRPVERGPILEPGR